MNPFRSLSLLAVALFVANSAIAQDPSATPKEDSGVHQKAPSSGPIVVKWKLKSLKGSANLMVNEDGTYLFSGDVKDKEPDKDFDITLGLKSSDGGVILFHYVGNASDGVQWSKQGQSDILKTDFQTFSGKIDWAGEWRLHESKEGLIKAYEAREKKLEKLRKEEAEARKKHDEKVAEEKKKEREKIEQEEIAAAQRRSGGGGGSSIGSDIESAVSTVGSVISTISSVGQAIAGLF